MKLFSLFSISLACWLLQVSPTVAQTTVSYFYDEAGNRIERTILINTVKSAKVDSTKQKEVFKETIDNQKILIYPNPTRGQLLVVISGYDQTVKTGLYLYNLAGSLVLSKSPVTGSDLLDLSPFPIGTYVLKIVLGDKKSEWKIIKE